MDSLWFVFRIFLTLVAIRLLARAGVWLFRLFRGNLLCVLVWVALSVGASAQDVDPALALRLERHQRAIETVAFAGFGAFLARVFFASMRR
jgi:hypothetical protein